ncbi:MAG: hypothetical protein FD119_3805 [Stygiobacter sp.]|nr:MAG: hypothetical protein FD119_3805 [Stygiobacter sp.]
MTVNLPPANSPMAPVMALIGVMMERAISQANSRPRPMATNETMVVVSFWVSAASSVLSSNSAI